MFVSIVQILSKTKIIKKIKSQKFVLLCQYTDLSARFEPGEEKMMMSSGLDVKPQYVHHMSPEPPPEVSHVIPNQKGTAP